MRTVVLALLVALPCAAGAGGVALVDSSGGGHGSVVASLAKGSVRMKITGLPTLPAQPPGATFTAYVYKTYLTSSADPAVEIFLGDVYPNAKQGAAVRIALKGDVSHLGLDRVVLTAYSKDARDSFDVLTATLAP
jgi:hypothetical protein